MLFNTFAFVVFIALVVPAHFALPYRHRWILLLAASCYFYMAFIPYYLLILALSIVIDYIAGLALEQAAPQRKLRILCVSLVANLGLLFVFKYFNFANSNLRALSAALDLNYPLPNLSLVLPIGLSFHTFQAMSYTIEVYRGTQRAERHFGIYALYVMFFPQLVAGPIERPQNMLHQFREHHDWSLPRTVDGMKLMLWGTFKKVVVADSVATVVNHVYTSPRHYSGLPLLVATLFFSVQIYCDFSGYSDIARGVAKVLGYELMVNFRQPYFARSISEFWKRWHISLSTWFRDYVYIPLGGNRVRPWRHYMNLLIVFGLSGLWHGAAWTFLVWGLVHGVALSLSEMTASVRARLRGAFGLETQPLWAALWSRVLVFCVVTAGWVFFRANSVTDAAYVLSHIPRLQGLELEPLFHLGLPRFEFFVAFLTSIAVFGVDWVLSSNPGAIAPVWERPWVRTLSFAACFYAIVFFGVFRRMEFIYFQF